MGFDGPFVSPAEDADDAAERSGGFEEGEEVLDETHAGVVAESEEVVDTFGCF